MALFALDVLFYKEGGTWIAQALQADIMASADSLDKLPQALERAVAAIYRANLNLGRYGLDGIPPAPPEFREMFELSNVVLRSRRGDTAECFNVRLMDT